MLVLGCFALSIAAVSTLPQVSLEGEAGSFTYSALEAVSVPSNYEGTSYSCLEVLECSGGEDHLCDAGSRLATARTVFLCCMGLAFSLFFLLFVRFLYLALGLYAGNLTVLLLLAGAALGLSLIGTFSFIGIAKISPS